MSNEQETIDRILNLDDLVKKDADDHDGYERTLVMKAINNALVAFHKTFEDEGVDAAYFRPKIIVGFRDSTFENDLERITYENLY